MFDMDDPGKQAVAECAALFTPGKCKLASLPLKDPNEMLVAGRGAEVIDAIWGAKSYKPDGIVSIADLRPKLSKPIEMGLSWPWPALTDATYGIREDEMYALGAGTGMGKSEIWKEVMVHLVEKHGQKVGGIFLEETPEHTVRCLAGKAKSKRFHVPDAGWTEEEFEKAVDELDASQSVFLYDHFGHTDYDTVKARIRFMVVSLGCKHIFLDHVTALASGAREMDERKELEYIMTDLASMLRELHFTLYFISHLNTPEGKPHEEGGRVMIRHFKGSRAIGQWSSFMFGA
jgi:twinkle protein